MANLRGSNFSKQVKNALDRLEARGTGRHGTDSHKTHSNALATKREMYLNDFKKHLEAQGAEGKLNQHFNQVDKFLEQRLEGLAAKTATDYAAGFKSMLQGLEDTKVPIPAEAYNSLNNTREALKEDLRADRAVYDTNRAVEDKIAFTANLERPGSQLVAELQLEAGFRVSEALEIANNPDKYLQGGELVGVVGKGGQEYPDKALPDYLAEKLETNNAPIPSLRTYQSDIENQGHKTHDLRLTYAKTSFADNLEKGLTEKEALQATSEQLNHHREDITRYYLNRA